MSRSRAILLLLLFGSSGAIVACSGQADAEHVLRFELRGGQGWTDLRFFVHHIELVDSQGRGHPLLMNSRPPWQTSRVALLDLAGADGVRNSEISGRVPAADSYKGLRFSVGIPFELNHGNPLTAETPLNVAEMFWAWQSGHKFLRADWEHGGESHAFHLGSTGCSSASALRPPATPCGQPNVMRIELLDFDPLRQPVRVDATVLIDALAGSGQRACTGDYTGGCAQAYAVTGLDSAGRCAGGVCRQQRLFAVGPST